MGHGPGTVRYRPPEARAAHLPVPSPARHLHDDRRSHKAGMLGMACPRLPDAQQGCPQPGRARKDREGQGGAAGPSPALYLPAAVGYGGDDRLFRRAAFHHQSRTKRIQKEKSWRIF